MWPAISTGFPKPCLMALAYKVCNDRTWHNIEFGSLFIFRESYKNVEMSIGNKGLGLFVHEPARSFRLCGLYLNGY